MEYQLCERCRHRAESRARVAQYLDMHETRGTTPGATGGMICDPAPKAECKYHQGYNYLNSGNRAACQDFQDLLDFFITADNAIIDVTCSRREDQETNYGN